MFDVLSPSGSNLHGVYRAQGRSRKRKVAKVWKSLGHQAALFFAIFTLPERNDAVSTLFRRPQTRSKWERVTRFLSTIFFQIPVAMFTAKKMFFKISLGLALRIVYSGAIKDVRGF
jgi:hypothetical protein